MERPWSKIWETEPEKKKNVRISTSYNHNDEIHTVELIGDRGSGLVDLIPVLKLAGYDVCRVSIGETQLNDFIFAKKHINENEYIDKQSAILKLIKEKL